MNHLFFSAAGIFVAVMFLKEPACRHHSGVGHSFPLAAGNEWIYRDSVVENGLLISVSFDTLRIEQVSAFEGTTSYVFNDGKEMTLSGDTLFQLVTQRGGHKYATPFFIPSETETSYNYAFGGDVMIQRSVKQLTNCPAVEWQVTKCYLVSDGCRGGMIVGAGVGIIREVMTECRSPKENYTSKTLVAMNLKN